MTRHCISPGAGSLLIESVFDPKLLPTRSTIGLGEVPAFEKGEMHTLISCLAGLPDLRQRFGEHGLHPRGVKSFLGRTERRQIQHVPAAVAPLIRVSVIGLAASGAAMMVYREIPQGGHEIGPKCPLLTRRMPEQATVLREARKELLREVLRRLRIPDDH